MASGTTPTPQTKQPDPPINGRSDDMPLKPTNSLELGQEPLSARPNKGPSPKLGALPVP
jgi:hypothetical protein